MQPRNLVSSAIAALRPKTFFSFSKVCAFARRARSKRRVGQGMEPCLQKVACSQALLYSSKFSQNIPWQSATSAEDLGKIIEHAVLPGKSCTPQIYCLWKNATRQEGGGGGIPDGSRGLSVGCTFQIRLQKLHNDC